MWVKNEVVRVILSATKQERSNEQHGEVAPLGTDPCTAIVIRGDRPLRRCALGGISAKYGKLTPDLRLRRASASHLGALDPLLYRADFATYSQMSRDR